MKFQVERNWIDVVGRIWMPPVIAAMRYDLSEYDINNIWAVREYCGLTTYEAVGDWLTKNSGDFQEVIDFHVVIGEDEFGWSDEENECKFNDCMYPEDD